MCRVDMPSLPDDEDSSHGTDAGFRGCFHKRGLCFARTRLALIAARSVLNRITGG